MLLLKHCKCSPKRGLLQHITSPVPHANPFGRFAATELAGEGPQGVAGHTGLVCWRVQGSCQSSRSPRSTSKSAMTMNRNTLRLVPRPSTSEITECSEAGRAGYSRKESIPAKLRSASQKMPLGRAFSTRFRSLVSGSWRQTAAAGCIKQVAAVEAELQLLPREPEGGLVLPGLQVWGGVGRRKSLPLGRRERKPVENGGARASTCCQPDPSQAASQRCRKPTNPKTAVAAREPLLRLGPWCTYTTKPKRTPPFRSPLFFAPVYSKDAFKHANHSEALQCKHYEQI